MITRFAAVIAALVLAAPDTALAQSVNAAKIAKEADAQKKAGKKKEGRVKHTITKGKSEEKK